MNRLLVFAVGMFVLAGCWWGQRAPTTLELTNTSGERVGYGFAVGDNFLTADHIYEAHETLFFEGTPIKVEQRFVDQDFLYFSLPFRSVDKLTRGRWSSAPLQVGEAVSWGYGGGVIEAIENEFMIDDRTYTHIATVPGEISPGMSGLPVHDERYNVLGIIVGGDLDSVFISGLPLVK